jgi:hypothetical protein
MICKWANKTNYIQILDFGCKTTTPPPHPKHTHPPLTRFEIKLLEILVLEILVFNINDFFSPKVLKGPWLCFIPKMIFFKLFFQIAQIYTSTKTSSV